MKSIEITNQPNEWANISQKREIEKLTIQDKIHVTSCNSYELNDILFFFVIIIRLMHWLVFICCSLFSAFGFRNLFDMYHKWTIFHALFCVVCSPLFSHSLPFSSSINCFSHLVCVFRCIPMVVVWIIIVLSFCFSIDCSQSNEWCCALLFAFATLIRILCCYWIVFAHRFFLCTFEQWYLFCDTWLACVRIIFPWVYWTSVSFPGSLHPSNIKHSVHAISCFLPLLFPGNFVGNAK